MYESHRAYRQETTPRDSKESFRYLNSLLHKVSADVSRELRETYGVENLIDADCNIRMEAYRELNPELFETDKEAVKEREKEWSGVENPSTRAYRLEKYQLAENATDKQIVEQYLLERSKEKSRQLEMMITVLLHKAFGQKYIVVRSAKSDDYFGGIDNVIVNKETGDVICAFDEVRENDRSDRRAVKEDSVMKKAQSGGAELVYGFSVVDGKVKLQSMSNLPLFCLGLDGEEYDELINAIEYEADSELNETEQKFLAKILTSIEEQKNRLLTDPLVQRNTAIVENLHKVEELFKELGDKEVVEA